MRTYGMSAIYPNRLVGQQVRILVLHPGSGTDGIVTRLTTASLVDSPDFETISYAWGNDSIKRLIRCDGVEISITDSLYGALQQMRQPQQSRLVWVDAVCINQHDIAERNQQVSLMHRIFSQASNVVVWLGKEGRENLHPAVQAINSIYQCCLDYADARSMTVADMTFEHMESVEMIENISLDSVFNHQTWLSISHFFARPWFERIWCAQEIILAKRAVVFVDKYRVP